MAARARRRRAGRDRAPAHHRSIHRYVPDGLSASDWAARQKKEKAAKVQNKAKYPKGAPQVPARRLGSFLVDGVASRRHAVAAMAYPHAVGRRRPSGGRRLVGQKATVAAMASSWEESYPAGAPSSRGRAQVLGVKEYLEKLQAKQTFYKNPVGNAKVAKSGHVYAKVKFGDFTKEAYDDWRKKGGKPPNNNEEGRSANHWF